MLRSAPVRILSLMLAIAVLAPLATTEAVFRSQDQDGRLSEDLGDLRPFVLDYRPTLRLQRRAYFQAIDRCTDLRRMDSTVTCPDFNQESYELRAAAPAEPEEVHASAPVSTITMQDLSDREESLLRRYIKTRACPESLKTFALQGFYELCLSLVGDKTPPVGLISDRALLRSQNAGEPATMELRMRMLEEARDPSTKRTDIAVPQRPTTSLKQRYLEEYGQ